MSKSSKAQSTDLPGATSDNGGSSPAINAKAGRWVSGQSGNPAGRPKSTLEARFACRQLNDRTLAVLVELLDDADGDLRYKAACRIRDEANGRPIQAVRIAAEEQAEVEAMTVEQLLLIATGKSN